MTCRELHDLISAYVDGEASSAERARVETHVASCGSCGERLASYRALRHAVARLEGSERPPEAVLARVEALRFRLKTPRGGFLRVAAWTGAVAASLVVAFLAGRAWFGGSEPESLAEELIADHMKYVPEAMAAQVTSSEPEHVRRFFEGKVPFEPVVPSLEGASLIGGRLCRIRGYYEQLLFYERGGRKVSLYVSDRPGTGLECDASSGYRVCTQRRDGVSLMIVGDASEPELRSLLASARLEF